MQHFFSPLDKKRKTKKRMREKETSVGRSVGANNQTYMDLRKRDSKRLKHTSKFSTHYQHKVNNEDRDVERHNDKELG